jgi:hypothetical protein
MEPINTSPKKHDNEDRFHCDPKTQSPCFVCGKPVDTTKRFASVHIHEGGGVVVTEEEAAMMDSSGDMYSFPIGPECLRKQPALKPYVKYCDPDAEPDPVVPVEVPEVPVPATVQPGTVERNPKGIVIPFPDNAGLILTRKNRITGYYVSLYRSEDAGIESDPETPYTTVCEQHGTCVCHSTRKLAEGHMAGSFDWCGYCQSIYYDGVDLYAMERTEEIADHDQNRVQTAQESRETGSEEPRNQPEETEMKNALLYDWGKMREEAAAMDRDEILAWLRVLSLRMNEIIQLKQETGSGEELIEGLEPDDVMFFPLSSFNALVAGGQVLRIQEATEKAGYSGLPSMYSSLRSERAPRNVQVAGDRYYFLEKWINDYADNKPKRGRPKPASQPDNS